MGNFSAGLIVAVVLGFVGQAHSACAPLTIELRGQGGVQQFSIEIADTEAERAQGLMQRAHMPTSAGMLFVYESPTHAFFWMKDTVIPLDMIFADASGRVMRVHSDATPQDLTPIDGGSGVVYVLEINAGLAKRMGIVEGTQMRAKAIEQSGAIWPCNGE